jgi:hypothetical protein
VSATATAEERADSVGHGLNVEQFEALAEITEDLYALMVNDPNPPECVHCATALIQPDTGATPALLVRRLPPGRLPRADGGPR